jgi:putative tryptophan/tyrosine transport system substrate-binding protein
MQRRAFVAGMAALYAAPAAVKAQQSTRVYRLGIISPAPPPASVDGRAVVVLAPTMLREFGYIEGQNLIIERRFAGNQLDRLPKLAHELVGLKLDVVLSVGDATRAMKDASKSVPIVMVGRAPVELGYVGSLAQPGGNITGVVISETGLADRRLGFLKEAAPQATRIAVLATAEEGIKGQLQEAERAASSLGLKLIIVEVVKGDYERAFVRVMAERADGLLVPSSVILNIDRRQIIALAAKHRLPAIYQWRGHAAEGGLMAYGSDIATVTRRAVSYIDRIFKGANPAHLPLEQPTTYELVINIKTANALRLTMPSSLLLRADQVIE